MNVTPDVIHGGMSGWRIRKHGERIDDSAEIECLRDLNTDLSRRIAGLTEELNGLRAEIALLKLKFTDVSI